MAKFTFRATFVLYSVFWPHVNHAEYYSEHQCSSRNVFPMVFESTEVGPFNSKEDGRVSKQQHT